MKAVYGLLNYFGSLLIQLVFEATFIKKLKMILMIMKIGVFIDLFNTGYILL